MEKLVSKAPFCLLMNFYVIIAIKTGNGKTHYIKKQLAKCTEQITIAINEAFSLSNAISKLRSVSFSKDNVGIFFNFTVLPPGVSLWLLLSYY